MEPLVHHLVNYVVMNDAANVTLAVGASPIMAHTREEVEELASKADIVYINIGTLDDRWVESFILALFGRVYDINYFKTYSTCSGMHIDGKPFTVMAVIMLHGDPSYGNYGSRDLTLEPAYPCIPACQFRDNHLNASIGIKHPKRTGHLNFGHSNRLNGFSQVRISTTSSTLWMRAQWG